MSDSDLMGASLGPSADDVSLARAALRGLTWRRFAITESIGLFIISMRYLEAGGLPIPRYAPVLAAELLSVTPLLILLAALYAEECVVRGRGALLSYSICLTIAVCCGAVIQCVLQAWVRNHFMPHPADLVLHPWNQMAYEMLDALTPGSVAMYVFHSRRSVARTLNRLRMAELSRVRLEQSVIESRLAATRTQMDSSAMLASLMAIGQLYRTAPQEADAKFDSFVESLQSRRSSFRPMSPPRG